MAKAAKRRYEDAVKVAKAAKAQMKAKRTHK